LIAQETTDWLLIVQPADKNCAGCK